MTMDVPVAPEQYGPSGISAMQNHDRNNRCIIVSGLSGAGKSVVLNTLEDLNFYCIDNLPISLLDQFARQLNDAHTRPAPLVAIGIDARNPEDHLRTLPAGLDELRRLGILTELVFVEANSEILTSRFSETRRKHPLSSSSRSLSDAIEKERRLLSALAEIADLRIDTSRTAVHELRDLVRSRIAERPVAELSLQFVSFGYKHGTPHDADFVFDVRCLPNPHWIKELRKYSGRDAPVIEFLQAQPGVAGMEADLCRFLETWVPRFESENRSYLCVAIGCTGGHHRSSWSGCRRTFARRERTSS